MSPLMEVLKKQNKKTDLLTTWTLNLYTQRQMIGYH